MTQQPEWNVAVVDGRPETIVNPAMVRELVRQSPLGPQLARQRLLAAGYPAHLLDDPDPKDPA